MLLIWRVALPAPRTSISTSSGRCSTGSRRTSQRALAIGELGLALDPVLGVAREVERPRQLLEHAGARAELEPLAVRLDRAGALEQDERRLLRPGAALGRAREALDAEEEVAPAGALGRHAVPFAGTEQEAHAADYRCTVADPTIRLTTAQALVRYLQVQESERDGERRRLDPRHLRHLRARQRRTASGRRSTSTATT